MIELVGWGTDPEQMVELANTLDGRAYRAHESEGDHAPYTAMLRVSTDDIEAVRAVSNVALYACFDRVIKPLASEPASSVTDRSIATFGLVRKPNLTHRECDDYWRDVHAPLALEMHAAMCDYTQLSVLHTFHGQPLDGIAMCAFASRHDLSTRFFNDDAAKAAILTDVMNFSDPAASPARVVLTEPGHPDPE